MIHTKRRIIGLFSLITVGALSACTPPTVPLDTAKKSVAQKSVPPQTNVKPQSQAVINANKQLDAIFSKSSGLF